MSTTIGTTTTTREPHDWREGRRLRALELHEEGWSGVRIAEALGVTRGAVSQWLRRARDGGGRQALRQRRPPGKRPALGAAQRAQLPDVLAQGAEAHGFVGEVWTTPRIATVIARTFGVRHHPTHVGRIMRALGWSVQQPVERATQRDEAAIAVWQQQEWPALQAKLPQKTERSFSSTRPGSTWCRS
jgi:transposase